MAKTRFYLLLLTALSLGFGSCRVYKQDIMFRLDEDYEPAKINQQISLAEQNYQIQPNDILYLEVYTNKGERIIDPNFELMVGPNIQQQGLNRNRVTYIVEADGTVTLPIVGKVDLSGKTLFESQVYLEERYAESYVEPYVILRYENKRVVVLGAPGGVIIPLVNENMTLPEVIALAGGIDQLAQAQNIRVLRGDLTDPQVFLVDLSTVEGMKASVVRVEPGDVIYIEPRRRVVNEAIRDVSPILSLITSVIALIAVLAR